jgi:hypothetical protein
LAAVRPFSFKRLKYIDTPHSEIKYEQDEKHQSLSPFFIKEIDPFTKRRSPEGIFFPTL